MELHTLASKPQYPQFRRFCGTYSGTRMKTMGGCRWRKPLDTCFINCSPPVLKGSQWFVISKVAHSLTHSLTGCLAPPAYPRTFVTPLRALTITLPSAMASRTSMALLCACIALLLLVNVSSAVEENQAPGAIGADSTTQQFYLRGNTVEAMTQGAALTEDATEESLGAEAFADYTPKANCRPKPCKR